MRKILMDTNSLLMPYEYRIDVVAELLRIVPEPVTILIASGTMDELRTLAGRTGRRAVSARFALQVLGKLRARFQVETIESQGAVDDWIIKYASKNNICVATNDVPLRKRLLALGVPVIAMKGKSKLDFV